ncbi:UBX domain-containing protein 2B isoform X1 [Eschrichtius robustus]|uniref:UBX domain-containing protein 2B isoform X1 n=1 Tax=Eschrichtius robustus TaxID=9764 RepID=UPI0035BEFFB9
MAEGGGGSEAGEEGPRAAGPRPPSARDLQLALAELYEDEVKCKASKSDRPHATAFKSPRTPPQRFYSSEHECSGLHIVRPSTGKIVNELFKEAREHGAVPLNEATRASGDDKSKDKCPGVQLPGRRSFTGGGYRLGNSFCKRSEYIYGETQLQDVQILLKLWSNGFSLDDGELRPYSDPTNAQFLESVKRGEVPPELRHLVHRGHVNLDMEDHQDQEYVRPRLRFKAFSGEGQKLGSLTPEIVSTPSSPEEEEKSLLNAVVLIDDSVPTTKIQIRLADGSRLIQRFNSTHRILDVRDFIVQSRPEFATLDFILVTSFPNKELTDESLTLQEADILNTVILQQLK